MVNATPYEDRCCGRFAPSPIGKSDPEKTCTHEFYLVRIEQETGEMSFVPHLSGPVALSRLDITTPEWRNGTPGAE